MSEGERPLKGKVRIVSWEQGEDRATETAVFSAQAEMKTLFANQFVRLEVPTGDGGTKTVRKPLFNFWLEHSDRPTAEGVTMDPTGGRFVDGKLNLWRGYGVEPDFADWSLLRHHIVDVVCAGNQEHADYVLRWIAWTLQHPTEPAEVAIVLPFSVRDATGQVRRVVHRTDPALARPALLLEVARARDRRLQHLSDVGLWTFLDQHGITKADDKRDKGGRYRRFPPLEQARQTFRERYPFWPEFSEPHAQWRFGDDEGFEVLPRP